MIKLLDKLYKETWIRFLDVRQSKQYPIVWIGFIVGYITTRGVVGLHPIVIYIYVAILLLCRFSVLQISLTFFIIALDADLGRKVVEANNYTSYVFIFLVIFLVKQYFTVILKHT